MKPENLNLKQAAAELNIDVPIMAIRALKDDVFELTLYGGRKVKYTPKKKAQQPAPSPEPTVPALSEPQAAQQPEPQPSGSPMLEGLTVKELRKLAGQAGIANASRLTKEQLIQSLSQE